MKNDYCQITIDKFIFIAVGTAVAGGPPHRSVREELPHTAPPLGITVRRIRITLLAAHAPADRLAVTALSPWQGLLMHASFG